MESDLQRQQQQQQQQQQQMSSSLLRYRSAPSSYFSNFLESEDCEEFLNHRPSSPETERIISRFFESPTHNLIENRDNSPFIAPMKLEEEETVLPQQHSNYSSASQMMFHSNMDRVEQIKMATVGSNSNLVRHSSSPAGLFANVNIENGFVTMREMANFGNANGNSSGEASFSSTTSRMKNQMNYVSGPPSSSGLMSPISEHGNKNLGILTSPENENFPENHSSGNFITGFPVCSWDDSRLMTESFSGMKRRRDDSIFGVNALDSQSEGSGNHPTHLLSHHLSLPKTSAEMASMEKLLQFQDSVPCKIRAKRGCATHPRSIAERVRRTRISERMRKLQELVPNMDTQTNTADMLDLAVDYIKDLQKEVQTLANNRSKCSCSTKK